MSITCISCHQATRHLNPTHAEITQQSESGEWGIDLILACTHCGQQYGAWVLNWDVVPLERITANSPLTPHNVNKPAD
ncbi:hypothetical protein [Candidatus Symbiopectobacterium sp.]|uniref:hypothetical protein n=1 Tax=Candidatus Symbiopectobacterium sp. TaxID=2816440 RepID=UPI0025C06B8C|nr:hypothetical protein [Candidatus Symbiopectobacterium sp.]